MAQMRSERGLLRRLGMVGRGKPVLACLAVVTALGGAGAVATLGRPAGFMVERGSLSVATAEDEAAADDAQDGNVAETEPLEGEGDVEAGKEVAASQLLSVVVHVDGAVASPGVYTVTAEVPRVVDAVERAGGLAEDADTSALNLASPLADGQKVYVPHEGEQAVETVNAQAASEEAPVESGLINLNTATEEELQSLPGVGQATAAAIVEERERNGPFASPEDIMRVSGIGQKKFDRIKDLIVV